VTRRRGQGEGSIYRRQSDGLWVGVAELGWHEGSRKRKNVYAKTRAEVARKLRETQAHVDSGHVLPDERRSTADYLLWWLTEVLPGTVKDSTADQYADIVGRYVLPFVGKVALGKLSPQHVQAMLRELESRGLSPRTRRQTRAILRRALGHAERWSLVSRNAAALVECPRIEGSAIDDALSLDEARRLLAIVAGEEDEAIVTVALMMGLRRGEALALRWTDVDLEAGQLTIRGTLKRRVGIGLVVDTPKTAHGYRTLPLPSFCVRALRNHRRRQAQQRMRLGPEWNDTGFVFTTPAGTPIDPRNLTRRYHVLTVRAGLGPRRFHALRHSAATLMLANGVPLEVISRTLGHAGLAITADVYAKVTKGLQRQAADAMDTAFDLGG